jgi:anti-anti-sigma factor
MNITERLAGRYRVIEVGEDIINPNVTEFAAILDAAIEKGPLCLLLDLSRVPYVTSRGLGAIVGAYTVLRKRGGNLILLSPQTEVRRSLELTRLDRILDIVSSEDEAARRLTI